MAGNRSSYDYYCLASVAIALGMAAAVYYAMPPASGMWYGALALVGFAIVAEFVPVNWQSSSAEVTISSPIHWASMILFGPAITMAVAAGAYAAVNLIAWTSGRILLKRNAETLPSVSGRAITFLAGLWAERAGYPVKWALKVIITTALSEAVLAGSAALAYRVATGVIAPKFHFAIGPKLPIILHMIFPFLLGVLVYFLVDEIRYVTARIVTENRPEDTRDWYSFILRWRMLLIETVKISWRQYILLPPITLLLVYLYIHFGAWSGLVVLGPFLSFRLSVQKAVEQEQMYLSTVATLGTYMQHYHPYTRGHLKRVADMSERLARELKLPAETVMLMPYAGLLHDIGKVGVSDEILDKVGKLTDDEWASIKEHPVKGAQIVEHLDFLNRTVDWIKYHHKWADGSGYPDDGTKNGGVPVEAAIIAVADAFDAMTDDREMSLDWVCDACGYQPADGLRPDICPQCEAPKRRVYREPLSRDDAINELRRGSGSQFKPEVVKAFLKMVDREGIRVGGSG